MIPVFANPSELENLAKEKYAIPKFLMMENAARGLADFILNLTSWDKVTAAFDAASKSLLILCGKGNNGGDGYAVARLLQDKCNITLICLEEPAAEEARAQYEMCKRLGIKIFSKPAPALFSKAAIILDCIYGTGFHGEVPAAVNSILEAANKADAIKIACDIPSGLAFKADYTITMGSQKLSLYSDKAKAVCGKIILQDIGISREKLEGVISPASKTTGKKASTASKLFLIEESDIKLPLRKDRSAHKGSYGHTAVFCGDKAGAAILSATAAMNFGSGLTSIITSSDVSEQPSNLRNFKISPALMLSDGIPKKATCLAAGSGFTAFSASAGAEISAWFSSQEKPAAVFDAGFLSAPDFPAFLKELNKNKAARIILTPHLAELSLLLKNLSFADFFLASLIEKPEVKIEAGKFLNSLFPRTAVIMKSANTFIAQGGQCFIVADGCQNLAKGGSGDILAGLSAALLAQGYSERDAAITAVFHHAKTAASFGADAYNLTPEKLLKKI